MIRLIGNWPLYLPAIAIGTVESAVLVILAKSIGRGESKEAEAAA